MNLKNLIRALVPGIRTNEWNRSSLFEAKEWYTNGNYNLKLVSISLSGGDFVFVEGGNFIMGYGGEYYMGIDARTYIPQHSVTLSSFYMCAHEVTQSEYEAVMGDNPSTFKGDNLPVQDVSWFDAVEYCNRKSRKEGLTPCYTGNKETGYSCNFRADGYRLPTEAEWEYAARGGKYRSPYEFSGSNNMDDVGWYRDDHPKDGSGPLAIKTKKPNALWLYDMSGNVWEWCWDWNASYSTQPQVNPTGASSGSHRVLRGGSFWCSPNFCAVYAYYRRLPSSSYVADPGDVGFRLVRSAP